MGLLFPKQGSSVKEERACHICGAGSELHVHHWDWNHQNNLPDNRILLCRTCHVWVHQVGYMTHSEVDKLKEMLHFSSTEYCSRSRYRM